MVWDVFFSYPGADKDAADRLCDKLRAARLEVFHDCKDVPVTASITATLTTSLAQSRLLVAWYSDAYGRSRACQWELTAAWLAGEGQDRRPLLVVNPLKDRQHIPAMLGDFLMLPATDEAALDDAVRRIVTVLDTPSPPMRVAPLPEALWQGHRRVSSPRFVGRVKEMWDIHGILTADAAQTAILNTGQAEAGLVHGLGGIGKSLLAEEYARRFGAAYPGGVVWLLATDGETARDRQLFALADRLGLPVDTSPPPSPARIAAMLQEHLAQRGRYLWIVDDLPSDTSAAALRPWLAPSSNGRTLVTTRGTRLRGCGKAVPLGVLSDAEAHALLTSRRAPVTEADKTAADALVEALGGHPLALDVAACAVEKAGYARTLAEVEDRSDEVLRVAADLADDLPTSHDKSITATLLHSIARLDEARGLRLLQLAALLAQAPIPLDLVRRAWGDAAEADLAIEDAFRESLVDRPDGDLFVHALVSRVIHLLAPPPPETRAAAVRVLNAVMPAVQDIRTHAALADWLPHAQALTAETEDRESLVLLGWLGWYEQVRGNYAAAAALRRRARDDSRRVLGEEHPDTLISINNLALTLSAQGDLAGARVLQEQALAVRRRVLGEEHPDTLTSINNLAGTLFAQGDHAGARALLEQALAVGRRVLGEEHPDTIISMGNLAVVLAAQGERAAARTLAEQAAARSRTRLGDDHPTTQWLLGLSRRLSGRKSIITRLLSLFRAQK